MTLLTMGFGLLRVRIDTSHAPISMSSEPMTSESGLTMTQGPSAIRIASACASRIHSIRPDAFASPTRSHASMSVFLSVTTSVS